jgi:hypothetical protein
MRLPTTVNTRTSAVTPESIAPAQYSLSRTAE